MDKNQVKITLVRKQADSTGAFYASSENIDLAKLGRDLNARKVRFVSFDMSKDTCELIIEPPAAKYANKEARIYQAKDKNGISTGMWTNKTEKGEVTSTNGSLDIDNAVRELGGASSVSVAIFRNQNKTSEDTKPHWNIKFSKYVPRQRAQSNQAGASSGNPM